MDKRIDPLPPTNDNAADLIRQKVAILYAHEPNAREELKEAEAAGPKRSKHQQYMHELNSSGKSLAEIQTAWHTYYQALPDGEKHEVWQEFYATHAHMKEQAKKAKEEVEELITKEAQKPAPKTVPRAPKKITETVLDTPAATFAEIKQQLLSRIGSRSSAKAKTYHHMQSIMFGLASGAIVVTVMLFGFFNERFIAPFITPSKAVSSTPIIIDPASTAVGSEPRIIIPKINVEIPVVYTEPSVEEHAIQKALEGGVVHYATTPQPGELGNGVIFGHSSNNLLNKGKYKFAFVMLRSLEAGDTFMLEKDGKRYVYKVFEKKIVAPTEVSVLGDAGKPATITLITCDPPGTSLKRMVVIGEQILPNPNLNVASSVKPELAAPDILPSNAPSLWERITNWF